MVSLPGRRREGGARRFPACRPPPQAGPRPRVPVACLGAASAGARQHPARKQPARPAAQRSVRGAAQRAQRAQRGAPSPAPRGRAAPPPPACPAPPPGTAAHPHTPPSARPPASSVPSLCGSGTGSGADEDTLEQGWAGELGTGAAGPAARSVCTVRRGAPGDQRRATGQLHGGGGGGQAGLGYAPLRPRLPHQQLLLRAGAGELKVAAGCAGRRGGRQGGKRGEQVLRRHDTCTSGVHRRRLPEPGGLALAAALLPGCCPSCCASGGAVGTHVAPSHACTSGRLSAECRARSSAATAPRCAAPRRGRRSRGRRQRGRWPWPAARLRRPLPPPLESHCWCRCSGCPLPPPHQPRSGWACCEQSCGGGARWPSCWCLGRSPNRPACWPSWRGLLHPEQLVVAPVELAGRRDRRQLGDPLLSAVKTESFVWSRSIAYSTRSWSSGCPSITH